MFGQQRVVSGNAVERVAYRAGHGGTGALRATADAACATTQAHTPRELVYQKLAVRARQFSAAEVIVRFSVRDICFHLGQPTAVGLSCRGIKDFKTGLSAYALGRTEFPGVGDRQRAALDLHQIKRMKLPTWFAKQSLDVPHALEILQVHFASGETHGAHVTHQPE